MYHNMQPVDIMYMSVLSLCMYTHKYTTTCMYLKCRSDFEFSEVDSPSREIPSVGDDKPSTVTDAQAVDHFPHEGIDGIADPVLELHLASPLQPLYHSSPTDILMPVLPQLPSPDKDVEREMEIDLKSQKGTSAVPSCMCSREGNEIGVGHACLLESDYV